MTTFPASVGQASAPLPVSGWEPLADALRAAHPPLLVRSAGQPDLIVDPASGRWHWPIADGVFPAQLTDAQVYALPESPQHLGPGWSLESLRWLVGLQITPGRLAPSVPTSQLRLRRWPNLTELAHTADQVAAIAMLSHFPMTADELSRIAGLPTDAAYRLVNALDLLALLEPVVGATPPSAPALVPATATDAAPAPAEPVTRAEARAAAEPRRGLFSRLRERFGR